MLYNQYCFNNCSVLDYSVNIGNLDNFERIALYAGLRKTLLNTKAIFSDETKNFRNPVEPNRGEKVTVKLRVAKNNIDGAYIHSKGARYKMAKVESEYYFDYYGYTFEYEPEAISYYFEVKKDKFRYFYNKLGIVNTPDQHYNFKIVYDFKTPTWSKGAVMYQIYIDRFCNGDPSNDTLDNEYTYLGRPSVQVKDWYQMPFADDIRNFYGGDLQGIICKLDYLKDLNIDAIYLNPIFVSPSNHKYDIQDYDYVDPHIGVIVNDGGDTLHFEKFRNKFATKYIKRTTDRENLEASNNLMIKLIEEAHNRGIKVILDGVFNHCGAFNKWLDKEGFYEASGQYPPGAYRAYDSPFHNFFKWDEAGMWPNNDAYSSWWGHDNHPKLNFEASRELYDYILQVGRKWVSPPFNADGWRLDVAADLGSSKAFNHQFWKDFRNSVKSANPDAIILAEHYGLATDWLQGDQWDTIMNYDAFMEPITWFLTGMEKHSESFRSDMLNNGWIFESSMKYNMSTMNIQNLLSSMNQLSNHDHSRFLTRTNMSVGRLHTRGSEAANEGINKGILYEAVTFMMTWPGAPTIYYGDEVGMCGWTDPDNRRPFPWGREDTNILNFHRQVISLRKQYPALKEGSVDFIFVDYGIICYGRWDAQDKFAIILNNDCRERYLTIPVWKIGIGLNSQMEQLLTTTAAGSSDYNKKHIIRDGQLSITLPAFSSFILKEYR